ASAPDHNHPTGDLDRGQTAGSPRADEPVVGRMPLCCQPVVPAYETISARRRAAAQEPPDDGPQAAC
ncbi:MAG: hypothetical protein ABI112_08015, partial [Terracoccus sp.]